MKMKRVLSALLSLTVAAVFPAQGRDYWQYCTDDARMVFFDPQLSQYIPHMMRMYRNGQALHGQVWGTDSLYPLEAPLMLITDWEDDGNGGVCALPHTLIQIGMAPLNFSFFVAPSTERYHHLFCHEYTHVVMTDKYNHKDQNWRRFFGTKVATESTHPVSALWSYLSVPRWYAPRWYHEGIACFMETWMGGGVGRALGGYDEMYFRSIIDAGDPLYSVVGLETEGTTQDFQVGTNSYLYGTRFTNYLVEQYGFDNLVRFYNRTDSSHTFFARQFKEVYGQPLRKVWNNWKVREQEHQEEQLTTLREYPLTPLTPLTNKPLGSVSPPVVDREHGKAYMAVNYPGDFAHLMELDLATGRQRRLQTIDGPQLYQTSYLTFDANHHRLIYTTHNGQIRSLVTYDLDHHRIDKKLNYQRVSNVVYDNASDRLYGLFSNAGSVSIVRYDHNLENREVLYAFAFGVSVFDLDVSHDGQMITVTTSGRNGEQSLLLFRVKDLEQAAFEPQTLCTWVDSNLGMFRFSLDDSQLFGSSYYTGVSNIWSVDVADGTMNLLSNTDIGLFAPLDMGNETLLALSFERDGMRPVTLHREVLHDANSVEFYGQKAYEKNQEALEAVGTLREPLPEISFGEVHDSIKAYNAIRDMAFAGAYPEISGFRDRNSAYGVTPVAGWRFMWNDPVGLSSVKMSVGVSPWSNNDWKNRIHLDAEWRYMFWTINASWNHTDFYDLFGPLLTSRKGYRFGASYDFSNTLLSPFTYSWGAAVNAYGGMDVLPMFQNVDVDAGITALQTASVYGRIAKTRGSLGAVMREQGWELGLDSYAYLAGGQFIPSISASADGGLLLPGIRNTSLWLRTTAGHVFGDATSSFGNEYFGGFRNNYVDCRNAFRYREGSAMPGAGIDEIVAHTYAKATGELNLRPIRYNDFGAIFCYPTWSQLSLFSSGLSTWNPGTGRTFYYNAGFQLTNEVVLFNYLKTTFSIGYAHLFAPIGATNVCSGNELMISLKLL